jgi:outer membrane lipoprotein SlyB
MNATRTLALAAALGVTGLLTACETTPSNNNTFSRSEAGRAQTVQFGTVISVRGVDIQNDNRAVATGTGAVLGGLAGSTIGGGRGAAAATVAGAVAGGAVGNQVAARTTPGVEVTVRLENGRTLAVVQGGSPNEFRVGDNVRVSTVDGTTRVSQ